MERLADGVGILILIGSQLHGTWKINVTGKRVQSGDFVDFKLGITPKTPDVSEPGATSGTGGINFTSSNLNYISTCDSNNLQFIMKGDKAAAGQPFVDFVNQTELARDTFLIGLVIPNNKQWISLPIMVNGVSIGGDSQGHPAFLRTETAQELLAADVDLKYDMFQDSKPMVQSKIEEWRSLIKNSSYYPQMQAQNFNQFPSYAVRTWITADSVTANGTGCKVFVTNSTLNVSVVMEGIWLDLSDYDFSSEITAHLDRLRVNWTQSLFGGYMNYATTTRIKVNNNSEYAELRTIYGSLALAQWYKNQDWSIVPYGDFINTENTSGLGLNVSHNQTYWEERAWQDLYTFQFTGFLGDTWTWNFHGGVTLDLSEPTVEGIMSNRTEDLMENATLNAVVQDGDDYYFSIVQQVQKPDITPTALWVNTSLTPDANERILLSTTVENDGAANFSGNFTVFFYYTYTYPTGYAVQRAIGNATMQGLNTSAPKQVNVGWNTLDIGTYTITVEADYDDAIEESSEINNKRSFSVQIVDPNPTASIESPSHGAQHQQDEQITFAGYGTDVKDGDLNESLYNWKSDVNGNLGNGSIIYANLSNGDHVITLMVRDSDGKVDTDQVLISVVPSEPPAVTLASPTNNQVFQEGETIYFTGSALDHEDGTLTGSSLSWNSSVNGFLSFGSSFSSTSLSVGNHNITLRAEDSSGVSVLTSINITVQESTPNITINTPLNNTQYYSTQNNVTFNGTAADPHEGYVSS